LEIVEPWMSQRREGLTNRSKPKCEPFTNVVERAAPFQFSTEPVTKPVPFIVSGNPAPSGATASGTKGWLIRGTGFAALVKTVLPTELLNVTKASRSPIAHRAKPLMILLRRSKFDGSP